MRTEWLEYFADAARLGSIKASAQKHFISPQGLSRSIGALEKELGIKLFERGANSVRITPQAEQLLPSIRNAVSAIQNVSIQADELREDSGEKPGCMLCSTFVFLSGLLDPLSHAFSKHGRQISYRQVDTERILEMLLGESASRTADDVLFGMTILFSPLERENRNKIAHLPERGFVYEAIEQHHDGILVAAHHPLANRESVSRDEIIAYPVISSCAEQLAPLKRYLGDSHVTMAITDLATRLNMILDERSVIVLPPFFNVVHDKRYRFIKIEDPYDVEAGLIYRDIASVRNDIGLIQDTIKGFYEKDAAQGLLRLL
jgi:DNA-binding transcriptional LysR family regulator